MKVLRRTLVPDESVPEFRRLRFEVADRPLREVLLNGLHPLGLARWFSSDRDNSSLAEVFADRLNGEEDGHAQLKEFGHSHEVKPPAACPGRGTACCARRGRGVYCPAGGG